jgi:hypothetical protein
MSPRPMTSANNGRQERVSRFSEKRIQIWYILSCDHCQLDTLKPDVVPSNLQVQTNIREELSRPYRSDRTQYAQ